MNQEERSWVRALVWAPGRDPIATDTFLSGIGATDGAALGLELLRDAVIRHDPLDVELALVVCFTFGVCENHRELLHTLAFADWHQRHEDVATALGMIPSDKSVDALAHLARWVPNYLAFDDARALAVKAMWVLGSLDAPKARKELESLANAGDSVVAGAARSQLER